MSFNFMAAVTICSDFGAPQIKSVTAYSVPHLFAMNDGTRCHDFSFLNVVF